MLVLGVKKGLVKCATVFVKNEVILMPVYKCQDLFSINVTKVIALICCGLIYLYLTEFEIYTGQIIWSIILDFLWPSHLFPSRTNSSLLPSQSVPTILVLKTWVGLWPWKKNQVKNMGCKKQGAKNRVIIIQKENRAHCLIIIGML